MNIFFNFRLAREVLKWRCDMGMFNHYDEKKIKCSDRLSHGVDSQQKTRAPKIRPGRFRNNEP